MGVRYKGCQRRLHRRSKASISLEIFLNQVLRNAVHIFEAKPVCLSVLFFSKNVTFAKKYVQINILYFNFFSILCFISDGINNKHSSGNFFHKKLNYIIVTWLFVMNV